MGEIYPFQRLQLKAVATLSLLLVTISTNGWTRNRDSNLRTIKQSSDGISGILVRVRDGETLNSDQLQSIIAAHGLQQAKWFPRTQWASFVSQSGKTKKTGYNKSLKSARDWTQLCGLIRTIPGVQSCSINERFALSSEKSGTPEPNCADCSSREIRPSKSKILSAASTCKLLDESKGAAPHRIKGLSTYWAQEYTGADLLRAELKSRKDLPPIPDHLYDVWDSDEDQHGVHVSNLIGGPGPSALLPRGQIKPHTFNLDPKNLIQWWENSRQTLTPETAPKVVNMSATWKSTGAVLYGLSDNLVPALIHELSAKYNTILVTAAMNQGIRVSDFEPEKAKSASQKRSLLVGSLSPDGGGSTFSNFDEAMTISAPADDSITSADKNGTPSNFGGTSAAAPQVTAALSAFLYLTDSRISPQDASMLLASTALPIPDLPTPSRLGAGMLNTYRIGAVADKIAHLCRATRGEERSSCVTSLIRNKETYHFEKISPALLQEVNETFPECAEGREKSASKVVSKNGSCERKKNILSKMRAAALLNPEESVTLWRQIACVHDGMGLNTNASYYRKLADRLKVNKDDDLRVSLKNAPYWPTKDVDKVVSEAVNLYETNHDVEQLANLFRATSVDLDPKKHWKLLDLLEDMISDDALKTGVNVLHVASGLRDMKFRSNQTETMFAKLLESNLIDDENRAEILRVLANAGITQKNQEAFDIIGKFVLKNLDNYRGVEALEVLLENELPASESFIRKTLLKILEDDSLKSNSTKTAAARLIGLSAKEATTGVLSQSDRDLFMPRMRQLFESASEPQLKDALFEAVWYMDEFNPKTLQYAFRVLADEKNGRGSEKNTIEEVLGQSFIALSFREKIPESLREMEKNLDPKVIDQMKLWMEDAQTPLALSLFTAAHLIDPYANWSQGVMLKSLTGIAGDRAFHACMHSISSQAKYMSKREREDLIEKLKKIRKKSYFQDEISENIMTIKSYKDRIYVPEYDTDRP
jgi:hypothetical protein